MKRNYAPVFIPTMNRYEHFKRLIESLQNNSIAKYTDLILAIDFPQKKDCISGYKKIIDFVDYGIDGFKSITVFKRTYNLGAVQNAEETRKFVYEQYDRCVFFEDDNIASKYALEFINDALDYFEDDDRVMSVCAYNLPGVHPFSGNIYFTHQVCAWGYGTWKNKDVMCQDIIRKGGLELILRRGNIWKIASNYLLLRGLVEKTNNGISRICMDSTFSLLYKYYDYYQVVPYSTFVINRGYDNSGVHGHNSPVAYLFQEQDFEDKCRYLTLEFDDDDRSEKNVKYADFLYEKGMNRKLRFRIKPYLWLLFYRMTNRKGVVEGYE